MTVRPATSLFLMFVVSLGCAQAQPPPNACNTPLDCPVTGNPCIERSCDLGACTTFPVEQGTVTAAQNAGDCQRTECDGDGNTISVADDADLPDDGNTCTEDSCNGGTVLNTPVASGTACADNGGLVCNPLGSCVDCLAAADCPGQDTACGTRVCENFTCNFVYAPMGTLIDSQVSGDCSSNVCDGNGAMTSIVDDLDIPDDGNDCTTDTCMNGTPQNTNVAQNSVCSQNGGLFCDGNGQCIECSMGSQCTSGVCAMSKCQAPSCNDGVKNGNESDVDCGGSDCTPCGVGDGCVGATDCMSGVCQGSSCVAPMVSATMPADGAMNVPVTTGLSVIFSGAMLPASLIGQTNSGPCMGSVRVSTDNFATCLGFSSASPVMTTNDTVASWTLSPALSYGNTYSVRVTTTASGIEGFTLANPYTSATGFTTETPPGADCSGTIVISQVYGGGGNSGAPYKNDYVELHNRGNATIDLTKWSVQYASAAGNTWLVTELNGSIAPGGYYLVEGGGGTAGGVALPAPDATAMTNMSATAGKLALVNSISPLSGPCPTNPTIVDFVGFGTTASCFEGAAAAPPGSNTASISRSGNYCTETNDNSNDFVAGSVTPRNTSSPPYLCPCVAVGTINESGNAAEIDLCNIQVPTSMTVNASATTPLVTGRVYEAGVTETAGPGMGVVVEIGYGSPNINPTTQSGWMFFPMTYNAQVGSADEYAGNFVAPATTGSYRYAVRASLNGLSWTYCDLNGAGSSSGATFEFTQLPVLDVIP